MTGEKFHRGTTIEIEVTFDRDGVAVDLTDAKVYHTWKKTAKDTYSNASIKIVVENHTDAVNGRTLIVIEPNDTLNLDLGTYYYDIVLVEPNGRTTLFDEGHFELRPLISDYAEN